MEFSGSRVNKGNMLQHKLAQKLCHGRYNWTTFQRTAHTQVAHYYSTNQESIHNSQSTSFAGIEVPCFAPSCIFTNFGDPSHSLVPLIVFYNGDEHHLLTGVSFKNHWHTNDQFSWFARFSFEGRHYFTEMRFLNMVPFRDVFDSTQWWHWMAGITSTGALVLYCNEARANGGLKLYFIRDAFAVDNDQVVCPSLSPLLFNCDEHDFMSQSSILNVVVKMKQDFERQEKSTVVDEITYALSELTRTCMHPFRSCIL